MINLRGGRYIRDIDEDTHIYTFRQELDFGETDSGEDRYFNCILKIYKEYTGEDFPNCKKDELGFYILNKPIYIIQKNLSRGLRDCLNYSNDKRIEKVRMGIVHIIRDIEIHKEIYVKTIDNIIKI